MSVNKPGITLDCVVRSLAVGDAWELKHLECQTCSECVFNIMSAFHFISEGKKAKCPVAVNG